MLTGAGFWNDSSRDTNRNGRPGRSVSSSRGAHPDPARLSLLYYGGSIMSKDVNGIDKTFLKSKKAIAFAVLTVVLTALAVLSIVMDRAWAETAVLACVITMGVVCAVLIIGTAAVDRLLKTALVNGAFGRNPEDKGRED